MSSVNAAASAASFPLHEEYVRSDLIGFGGFGVVFTYTAKEKGMLQRLMRSKNKETIFPMRVAVKEINWKNSNPADVDRELKILGKVKHKNIVTYSKENDKKIVYVIMELCKGNLQDMLTDRKKKKKNFPFSEDEAIALISQILSGVGYLHGMDIAHRDMKPSNILAHTTEESENWLEIDVTKMTLKLTDFGSSTETSTVPLTQTHKPGTDEYMAPEVMEAKKTGCDLKMDLRPADVYAVGIIACQMTNAKSDMNPGGGSVDICSIPFNDFLDACLQKQPEKRQTVTQLLKQPILIKTLEAMEMKETKKIKLVVVGDGFSGRHTLVNFFATGNLIDGLTPVIFENYTAIMDMGSKVKVELDMWVTAEQEDVEQLCSITYPNTDIFLVCFSIVNPWSLNNIPTTWVPEVRSHCPNSPFILVGLKKELRSDPATVEQMQCRGHKGPVTEEKGRKMAAKVGASAYVECSSYKNQGVREVFEVAVRVALEDRIGRDKCIARGNTRFY